VSRLDSFIRRLEAQRACLDFAARLVEGFEGDVLELGLGNGRTYDHLRQLFPDRKIYACERRLAAHPDCVPPAEYLLLGDMRETLRTVRELLADSIALAHLDPGTGDLAASRALALELTPLIVPLLRSGAILVSEPALRSDQLSLLEPPESVAPERYNIYRRVSRRSQA
jgi:S-adenosyl-L-methionine methyltransferase